MWAFGGSISVPLLTFGRISNNVKVSEAAMREALANYALTVQGAFRDIRNALVIQQRTTDIADTLPSPWTTCAKPPSWPACVTKTVTPLIWTYWTPSVRCSTPKCSCPTCAPATFRPSFRCAWLWAAVGWIPPARRRPFLFPRRPGPRLPERHRPRTSPRLFSLSSTNRPFPERAVFHIRNAEFRPGSNILFKKNQQL